jgi:cell division cycle 14
LEGLEYGIKLNLYSITTFNLDEYEYYEKLENGDLNWLIPGRFLAFSSPIDIECDYMINTRQYVNIFKKMGIKLVIRLNQKEYDRNVSSK